MLPLKLLVLPTKYTPFVKDGEGAVIGSFLLSALDRLKVGAGVVKSGPKIVAKNH